MFRQAFQSVLSHAEERFSSKKSPPPIPTHSKPSYPSTPHAHTSVPYWQPTFDPSVPVSAHFAHELGAHGWGNNEAQNYTSDPNNSFHVHTGPSSTALVLRAIASSSHPDLSQRYTSARLTSHQRLSRRRGCLTARLTAPCAQGIWPAFWLLPADPFKWPEDGEIDIFESWNGDRVNHSCLHWGQHNGEDWNKHRVVETRIADMDAPRGHEFSFVWDTPEQGEGGRLMWCIDGRPVMKAVKPQGTRRMEDWRVILNVAIGGNVCQGNMPKDGCYDFVVHELKMCDDPPGGWGRFEADWHHAKEGHAS